MRTCPYCGKGYPDEVTVCAIDGESLAVKSDLPLDEKEKEWIEKSFQWLLDEFGKEYFLKHKTILPEAPFFPDKYSGSEDAVIAIVKRVCSYMDINADLIDVE